MKIKGEKGRANIDSWMDHGVDVFAAKYNKLYDWDNLVLLARFKNMKSYVVCSHPKNNMLPMILHHYRVLVFLMLKLWNLFCMDGREILKGANCVNQFLIQLLNGQLLYT